VTMIAPVGPPCQGQMWVHPVVCTPNNSLSYIHFFLRGSHIVRVVSDATYPHSGGLSFLSWFWPAGRFLLVS